MREKLTRHSLIHEDMKKFFEGFSPNAHPMAILSAMVASFSTYYPNADDVDRQHRAPAGQGEDDRRVLVQEVDRPAVHLSEQRPLLHRELPAHDVRRAGRALRGLADARPGAESAAHPARRPRAELLDVDGAHGGLVGSQPLRVDLGRHLRPVGPAPRRREPGGHRDARASSRRTAATTRSTSTWRRTRTRTSG